MPVGFGRGCVPRCVSSWLELSADVPHHEVVVWVEHFGPVLGDVRVSGCAGGNVVRVGLVSHA